MPNFSEETIENFRAARVRDSEVPTGLDAWQVGAFRRTLETDVEEEQARLQAAEAQVRESRAILKVLQRKAEKLKRLYG